MAGKWDSNLKRLVKANPQAFIGWLLKGAVVVRELSIELNRDILIDVLYEVLLHGELVLIHIEFQRYDEKEMARRLLEYNVYATCKFDCPVISFVIYLKKEGNIVEAPLVKKLPGGMEIWRFNFTNIKLWEIPTEVIRDIQSVGILPLLALTREGARPEVVDEALVGIEQAPIERGVKDDLLTITLTLATLALPEPEHLDWLKGRFYMYQDLIRDTEIYQLIVQEGLQEGRQKGRQEGLQEGLQQGAEQEKQQEMQRFHQAILELVEARFPELLNFAKVRTEALSDLDLSYQLLLDVGKARSQEEARRVLEAPGPDEKW